MCDVQAKLIAWFDRELPPEEASEMDRHVKRCRECQSRVALYERVSKNFDVFCDAMMAAKAPRRVPRWVPVLASAVVASVLMYLIFPRVRVEAPFVKPIVATASVPVPGPPAGEPVPPKRIRRRHAVPRVQAHTSKWQPMETAIQIAIPADAMFPPGAVPNGMNLSAELIIAPDGSVKQVRLRQ